MPTEDTDLTVTAPVAPASKPPFVDRNNTTVPPRPDHVQLVPELKAKAKVEKTPVDQTVESNPDADELPAKYKGKTPAQIAEMHRNLESEKGRMANELGQLRRTVDELLTASFRSQNPDVASKKKREPVTSDKLLTDPDAVLQETAKAAVKDDLDANSDRVSKLEYQLAQRDFDKDFPDAAATMGDESFIEWVKASPYRLNLATQAHTNGSFPAARELFGLYGETKEVRKAKVEAKPKTDPEAAKAATTVRPGNSSPTSREAKKADDAKKGPVLKRGAIRKLFVTNRNEYMRRMEVGGDIYEAYRDNRVIE